MRPNPLRTILTEAGENSCQVFFDPDGRVVYANDHFRNAIPLTKQARIDPKGDSIIQPADRKKLMAKVMECLSTPSGEGEMDIAAHSDNGSRACKWKFVTLADKEGRVLGVYGEGIDVNSSMTNRMREILASELLDKVADAIVFTDPEFRIIIWNRTAEEHYGISAQEAVGKKFNEIIHFDQPTDEYESMQAALRTTGEWNGEVSFTRPGGNRIVVWIRSKLVRDNDGQFLGFLGVGRDITDMNKAGQMLTEKAGLLRNLSEAVAYMDLDLKIRTINRAGEELFGITEKDAIGKPMLELVGIHLHDGLDIDELGKILERDDRWEGELDMTRPDGRKLDLHGSVVTLQDNKGDAVGYLAVCRDITYKKSAEDDLRLRAGLLENMSEAVVFTDSRKKILSLNSTAEAVFGLKATEVIGATVDDHFQLTPLDGATRTSIGEALLKDGSWEGQIRITRPDGTEATLNIRVFTIWTGDKQPQGFLTFARDISKLSHEERQRIIATNLLNSITEGVYSYGTDGKINSWNKAMESIYGVDAKNALGKTIEELVTYELIDTGTEGIVKSLTETGKWSGQVRVFRPDGGAVLLECNTTFLPVTEETGFSHLTVVRDITDLVETLRRQHEHEALLNNLEDLIISMDKDFRILAINRATENLLGLSEEQVVGKMDTDIIPYTFITDDLWKATRILREKGRWDGRVAIPRINGDLAYFATLVTAAYDDQRNIIGYVEVHRNITERMEAEKRDRYNAILLDNIEDAVVAFDHEFRIVSINKAAQAMYDLRAMDVNGAMVREAIPWELQNTDEKAYQSAIILSGHWSGEAAYTRKDGTKLYLSATTNRITGDQGEIVGFVTMSRDITARKEDEQRQQANSVMMRSISDVIVSLDKDMHVATMNPAAERILGKRLVDIRGSHAMKALPLDFLGVGFESVMAQLQERGTWQGETTYQHPDGHTVYFLTLLNMLYDDRGKSSGIVGVHHDISAQQAERRQAQYNALLLDNMSDGVVSMLPDFTILAVNRTAELATGFTNEQLVGRNANEIIPLDFMGTSLETIKSQVAEKGSWTGRTRYHHPKGHTAELMTTVNAILDEKGGSAGVVTVNRDITEQVEEEKRQQYNMLLMRNIREVIVATDPDNKVTYMNPWAEELLGHDLSDVIGHVSFDVMPLTFLGCRPEDVFQSLGETGQWEGPTLYSHPDGRSIPFHSRFSYMRDEDGKVTGLITVCTDQTSKQEADRQHKYNTLLLNNMTDAVVTIDGELRVTYMNPAAEKLSGLKLEDVKGKSGLEIMPAEYVDATNEEVLGAITTTGIWNGRAIFTRADGQRIHLLTTFNTITNEKGEFEGIIAVNKDITQQREIEEAQRYNSVLMNNITDAVISLDDRFRLVTMNAAAENIFGEPQNRMVGLNVNEAWDMDYLDQELAEITRVVLHQGNWSGNVVLRRKDGQHKHLSAVFNAFRSSEGRLTGFIGTFRDITDRMEAEQQQKLAADLMERVSDAVAYYDQDLRILYVNKTAEDMLDIIAEDVRGKRSVDAFTLNYVSVDRARVIEELRHRGYWHGDATYTRPDGRTLHLHLRHRVIRDLKGGISGYISNITDVTELMDAQKAQRLAAGVMESVDDAIGYFDHELRVIYLNPASETIMGVSVSEAMGRVGHEVFPVEYIDTDFPAIHDIVNREGRWTGEGYFDHPDGRRLYLSLRFNRITDANGKITGYISTARDITERAEMDRRIRFNAMLLDKISEGVVASDRDFRVIYMNPAAQSLTGVIYEEVKGKITTEAVDLYYPGVERKEVQRLIREEGSWTGEATCLKPDGNLVNMILTHARYYDDKGQDAGFITVGRDITELRRTWDKLEDMSLIARKTQNSVVISDELERIIWVNEGFSRLTGYSWEEAIGKTTIDLLTGPETDRETVAYIRKKLTRHEPLNTEYRLRMKNGNYRWIRVEGQPVFDEQGAFKKYFRIQTDIQEAKEHLAEVETLSLIAKHTDNMVTITDEQDRITWVNDAFIRNTGFDLLDAAGEKTVDLLAGPDSSPERNRAIAEKVAQHEPFRMEVLIYTKEGRSRWCQLEARPIFDEAGRFTKYFRMYADIQERKDHEQMIAESQKRLEDLFNTRFEAMAILDRDGKVLDMNARAEETSHRKKEELIGKYPWEHDFTGNNPTLADFFHRAIDTCKQGKDFHEPFSLDIPGGGVEVQVFSFRPVIDAFGNLNYIQMEVSDITEKETAKKSSQYNEQLFNAYMKNSPVPAWITSLTGRIENMNERFLEFIGKDESVIGMNIVDVIDHTYLAQYRQHNEVVVKTQKPLQAIEYALDKDKVVHTFLNTRFPIFEDGKLTKIGGMGMDITSILKAEEERNESIRRFEAVSRATDDMIWEWDIIRDKVIWQGENKRHWVREMRTGDTMREFLDFLHKDDRDMVDSSLRRSIKNRNKDRWQAEYRMKGPNGEEVHILDRAVILRDIEGNASRMIGAMQDITDRVNMEKDFVRHQEEEHKKTTRMIFDAQEAERSRLAADLHDNVNPLLAAARLHINAAEATSDDPAPYLLQSKSLIHEGIEEIRKISHNLSNTLINEISLEDLVLSTLRKLNPEESLEVHTDFRKLDSLDPVTSMKLNVIRIIQEQVHNTLKYAQASNLYIKLHYRDKTLYLTIQDDGQGFDMKSTRTGIGLANIKNRVESYNGRMKLTSSPGKGCKMEIQLPVE